MKHADGPTLDELETLLGTLRGLHGMKERTRGIFYRRGKAFLHFHIDKAGLFADLRVGADFVRQAVNSMAEREALLAAVVAQLNAPV